MFVYALIKAGEGDTEDVFISFDRYKLREKVCKINTSDYSTSLDYDDQTALLMMLDEQENWNVGRHVLKNKEPIWQEWTLIIEDI